MTNEETDPERARGFPQVTQRVGSRAALNPVSRASLLSSYYGPRSLGDR